MLLFGILATVANAGDFSPADMPCARAEAPSLVVNTASVPWPFKGHAARLVMESKAQADAHAERCTELLTVAVSTAAQDEAAAVIGTIAVADGKSVSFDGRRAVAVTADAAMAHELPNGAFGYGPRLGGYGSVSSVDLVTVQNLGFLQGQNSLGTVSGGGSAKSTPPKSKKSEDEIQADAAAAKAKAEAERKARVEAAKAAAAAVSGS